MQRLNWFLSVFLAFPVALMSTGNASAQDGDDAPIDIDFGSSRVGGPGLTDTERRINAYEDTEEEVPTEDNIPAKDDPKRLPHLHVLAKRYASGSGWRDACARYDQIIAEGGEEGLDVTEDGRKLAGKSFLKCGEYEAKIGHEQNAEKLLIKSERYLGKSDYRHRIVRRNMLKEQYRTKMLNGDVEGALSLYDRFQNDEKSEDERIWMGDQLSKMAEDAYKTKDKELMRRYIKHAERVSPKNPTLRRLKKKVHTEEVIVGRALGAGLIVVVLAFLFTRFGRWRGRKKIENAASGKLSGKKNKFLDDDID